MGQARGIHILYVDHEPDIAELVTDMLEREDDRFAVETATSVSEGLDQLAADDFDCVVSEYDLPNRNGIEFLTTVRDVYPDLPFILYTGKGSEKVASDAISADVTDYLLKKFDSDQYVLLANRVGNAVIQYWAEQRAAEMKERYQPLFEHTDAAIAWVAFDGETPIVRDVNPAFEALFGPPGEVVGTDLDAIVVVDERRTEAKELGRQVRDGQSVHTRVTCETTDGMQLLDVQILPVRASESDETTHAFAIYTEPSDKSRHGERLQAFVKESMDIITVLEPDGTIQYESPSIERVLGYEPAELVGDNAFEYIHPDDRAAVVEAFEAAVEDPDMTPTAKYRFRDADGSWRWLESRGNNQLDNPVVEGFIVNTRDISERMAREQELERARNRMEFALQATDAIVWDWDVDEDRATFYPSEKELYGTTVETWDDFMELVHPEDRQEVRKSVDRALDTGEPKHEEVRILHNGDVRWIEAPGQPIEEDGRVTRMVGVARDITKRKRREQKLRLRRNRFRALFENLGEPVVEVIFEGEEPLIERVNDPFNNIFDIDEEVKGENLDGLIVPADDETADLINEHASDGVSVEREVHRGTDELRPFLFRSAPFVGPNGKQRGHGIYIDITERKQRERELERKNERLEKFASVVSHDLRNPLSVARGNLHLAREECDSEYLDDVADAHDRMETLIKDLLTLARGGERVDETEPVILAEMVGECWGSVWTADATLVCDTEQRIQADSSRLKQLLENLLSNAADHGGEDVTITVGDLDDGFYVADDGPGIPDAVRDKVFEAGYSTTDEGSGFGLNIVQEIAEAHGWEIAVADSESGGARFEITGVETAAE